MSSYKKTPIEFITTPLQNFMQQEKSGGIVLGVSVFLAIFLANSPIKNEYHHILEHSFGFIWDGKSFFNFNLHHWINDGLMAIFFFVVGLELKREIVGGELSNPRKALLPVMAALGGMLFPAIIYISLNSSGEVHSGWGIPMATDIAFALGVLHLLGNRIPLSLKIFLTALAIVDDLGAVLVIALFYTSDISTNFLVVGLIILMIMFIGNKLGIKSIWFYAVLGIGGLWSSFLLSGVHATIAAVLAAFTIPTDVKIKENLFTNSIKDYLTRFKKSDPFDKKPTLTHEQLQILDEIKKTTIAATPVSQRLEYTLHPIVSFLIVPIFALANAGVSLDIDFDILFSNHVALGVALGLLIGKVIGIVGFTWVLVVLKIAPYPTGMNLKNLIGLGFLGSIGFTMSLFVTTLAFQHPDYITQAKIGIFTASILGGSIGYLILSKEAKTNMN